jgi:hypothetical protein
MAGADLSGIDFSSNYPSDTGDHFGASMLGADLRNAQLEGCTFTRVDLAGSNLRGVHASRSKFTNANLYSARFEDARLSEADLDGANLVSAEIHQTQLDGASVKGARFGKTSIFGVDLSGVVGLQEAVHICPSVIDAGTLRATANGLSNQPEPVRRDVFQFLSDAGMDRELLAVVRTWIDNPIEYYSVFISHSSIDKEFARKLYRDLTLIGVRCWIDEKEILPGDNIMERVDQAIRVWDRLILVCSQNSLSPRTGWWVEREIERAFQKEAEIQKKRGKSTTILVPISIDSYVHKTWKSAFRASVLARHVGDFRDWRSSAKYQESLDRLRRAINESRK